MKMAKNKMRILAVLLAIVTVLAIIPAAAVSAASGAYISGTAVSGQKVAVSGYSLSPVPYSANTLYQQNYNNADPSKPILKFYGQLTFDHIMDVVACDFDLGATPTGIFAASDVSVYETTVADYDLTALRNNLNTALDGLAKAVNPSTNKGEYYAVPALSAVYKNKLQDVSFYYSGTTTKTVYLYAQVTPYTYTFNIDSTYAPGSVVGTTRYERIGSVTLFSGYSSAFDLQLSQSSITMGANETATVIASVPGVTNVKYEVSVASAPGVAAINMISNGIFTIQTNSIPSSSNTINFAAYQTDGGSNYMYRSYSGDLKSYNLFVKDGIDGSYISGVPGTKYYPIYDTAALTIYTATLATGIKFTQSLYSMQVTDTAYASVSATSTGSVGTVSYTSSNPSVVAINAAGQMTATGVGTATIYATTSSGASATAYVTVSAFTARVSLNKSAVSLKVGDMETLKATVATIAANKAVVWSSSNSTVASVDANGVITAKKVGSATITASSVAYPGRAAYCYVTVKEPDVKITATEKLTVKVGESANIGATITGGGKLIYASDKNSVAMVDSTGKVTGVSEGAVMVTIMSATNSAVKAYCIVTVVDDEEEEEEEKGIIEREAYYSKYSKYYLNKAISNAEVKAALAELKGEDEKDVVIAVTTDSDKNRVSLSRYAIARLAKYADTLTVKINDDIYILSNEALEEMSIGRPVYIYTTPTKEYFRYKNAAGEFKNFKNIVAE